MKRVVYKLYWDYEKEEKWLNEMSAMGLSMSAYSWCRYVFDETPDNAYLYRIELMKYPPSHPESANYIRFLEENGVEYVASYMRWIYLRKKSADGPFDLYTDLESRLTHYRRIKDFWSVLMYVEFAAGICNLAIGIINVSVNYRLGNFTYGNITEGLLLILLGTLFYGLTLPLRKKIKTLKKEQAIRE